MGDRGHWNYNRSYGITRFQQYNNNSSGNPSYTRSTDRTEPNYTRTTHNQQRDRRDLFEHRERLQNPYYYSSSRPSSSQIYHNRTYSQVDIGSRHNQNELFRHNDPHFRTQHNRFREDEKYRIREGPESNWGARKPEDNWNRPKPIETIPVIRQRSKSPTVSYRHSSPIPPRKIITQEIDFQRERFRSNHPVWETKFPVRDTFPVSRKNTVEIPPKTSNSTPWSKSIQVKREWNPRDTGEDPSRSGELNKLIERLKEYVPWLSRRRDCIFQQRLEKELKQEVDDIDWCLDVIRDIRDVGLLTLQKVQEKIVKLTVTEPLQVPRLKVEVDNELYSARSPSPPDNVYEDAHFIRRNPYPGSSSHPRVIPTDRHDFQSSDDISQSSSRNSKSYLPHTSIRDEDEFREYSPARSHLDNYCSIPKTIPVERMDNISRKSKVKIEQQEMNRVYDYEHGEKFHVKRMNENCYERRKLNEDTNYDKKELRNERPMKNQSLILKEMELERRFKEWEESSDDEEIVIIRKGKKSQDQDMRIFVTESRSKRIDSGETIRSPDPESNENSTSSSILVNEKPTIPLIIPSTSTPTAPLHPVTIPVNPSLPTNPMETGLPNTAGFGLMFNPYLNQPLNVNQTQMFYPSSAPLLVRFPPGTGPSLLGNGPTPPFPQPNPQFNFPKQETYRPLGKPSDEEMMSRIKARAAESFRTRNVRHMDSSQTSLAGESADPRLKPRQPRESTLPFSIRRPISDNALPDNTSKETEKTSYNQDDKLKQDLSYNEKSDSRTESKVQESNENQTAEIKEVDSINSENSTHPQECSINDEKSSSEQISTKETNLEVQSSQKSTIETSSLISHNKSTKSPVETEQDSLNEPIANEGQLRRGRKRKCLEDTSSMNLRRSPRTKASQNLAQNSSSKTKRDESNEKRGQRKNSSVAKQLSLELNDDLSDSENELQIDTSAEFNENCSSPVIENSSEVTIAEADDRNSAVPLTQKHEKSSSDSIKASLPIGADELIKSLLLNSLSPEEAEVLQSSEDYLASTLAKVKEELSAKVKAKANQITKESGESSITSTTDQFGVSNESDEQNKTKEDNQTRVSRSHQRNTKKPQAKRRSSLEKLHDALREMNFDSMMPLRPRRALMRGDMAADSEAQDQLTQINPEESVKKANECVATSSQRKRKGTSLKVSEEESNHSSTEPVIGKIGHFYEDSNFIEEKDDLNPISVKNELLFDESIHLDFKLEVQSERLEELPELRPEDFGISESIDELMNNFVSDDKVEKDYLEDSSLPNNFKEINKKNPVSKKSGKTLINCDICGKSGFKKLNDHYVNQHPTRSNPFSIITEESFLLLQAQSISDSPQLLEIRYNQSTQIRCIFCSAINGSISVFCQHLTSHTGEYRFQCTVCKVKIVNKAAATSHCKVHRRENIDLSESLHVTPLPIDEIENEFFGYICRECNYFQLRLENIMHHLDETSHSATDIVSIKFKGPHSTDSSSILPKPSKLGVFDTKIHPRLISDENKSIFHAQPISFSNPPSIDERELRRFRPVKELQASFMNEKIRSNFQPKNQLPKFQYTLENESQISTSVQEVVESIVNTVSCYSGFDLDLDDFLQSCDDAEDFEKQLIPAYSMALEPCPSPTSSTTSETTETSSSTLTDLQGYDYFDDCLSTNFSDPESIHSPKDGFTLCESILTADSIDAEVNSPPSSDQFLCETQPISYDDPPSEDETLGIHVLNLEGYDLFRCGIPNCDVKCINSIKLREHLSQCISSLQIKCLLECKHCSKSFKQIKPFLDHIPIHGKLRQACALCSSKYLTIARVKHHFKVFHGVVALKSYKTASLPTFCSVVWHCADMLANRVHLKDIQENSMFYIPRVQFLPEEIDDVPKANILAYEIHCAVCKFTTKVRSNLIRHLKLHKEIDDTTNTMIPAFTPINPVPWIERKERMFDKMTNWAGSSHELKQEMQMDKDRRRDKYPHFVVEQFRFVCSVPSCKQLTVDENLLRAHMRALHSEVSLYDCPHCDENEMTRLNPQNKIPVDKLGFHLKLHGSTLLKCAYCDYLHFQTKLMEKHVVEKHGDKKPIHYAIRHENTSPARQKRLSQDERTPNHSTGWKCLICKSLSLSWDEAKEHCKNIHHVKGQFMCDCCQYSTSSIYQLEHHITSGNCSQVNGDPPKILVYFSRSDLGNEKESYAIWRRTHSKEHLRGIYFLPEEASGSNATVTSPQKQSSSFSGIRRTSPVKTKPSNQSAKLPKLIKEKMPVLKKEVEIQDYGNSSSSDNDTLSHLYSCFLCKMFHTTTVLSMDGHLRQHLDYHICRCRLCFSRFYTFEALKKHVVSEHKQTFDPERCYEPLPINQILENKLREYHKGSEPEKYGSTKKSTNNLPTADPLELDSLTAINPIPPPVEIERKWDAVIIID